jgi:hypothetical protein
MMYMNALILFIFTDPYKPSFRSSSSVTVFGLREAVEE